MAGAVGVLQAIYSRETETERDCNCKCSGRSAWYREERQCVFPSLTRMSDAVEQQLMFVSLSESMIQRVKWWSPVTDGSAGGSAAAVLLVRREEYHMTLAHFPSPERLIER